MVWGAIRSGTIGSIDHVFTDTVRGANPWLASVSGNAQNIAGNDIVSFNSDGFSLGYVSGLLNASDNSLVAWSFLKQPKFFDIVTYTGTGSNRTILHNLGSVPGCIIVKCTSSAGTNWQVYHNSLTSAAYGIQLNSTAAQASATTLWNSTAPTSTAFSVGTSGDVNASGGTYVAYIFAHNAGGFGTTGTDNVISCGSYIGNGSVNGPTVNLGYEPQWLLIKRISTSGDSWILIDNMRGFNVGSTDAILNPNNNNSESFVDSVNPTATGFQIIVNLANYNGNGDTFIYIAIRRGPMKTPTVGTSVFSSDYVTNNSSTKLSVPFPIDMQIAALDGSAGGLPPYFQDRLRGFADDTATTSSKYFTGRSGYSEFTQGGGLSHSFWNYSYYEFPGGFNGSSIVFENFRRAPSVFDMVCYSGTNSIRTINHNLTVAPEMAFIWDRTDGGFVLYSSYSAQSGNQWYLSPTSSVF
jgi:hypothetical protein